MTLSARKTFLVTSVVKTMAALNVKKILIARAKMIRSIALLCLLRRVDLFKSVCSVPMIHNVRIVNSVFKSDARILAKITL